MQQRRMVLVGLVSVVLGAGAAVGIVAGFDLGGGHTSTIVEEAPLASHDDTSNSGDADRVWKSSTIRSRPLRATPP